MIVPDLYFIENYQHNKETSYIYGEVSFKNLIEIIKKNIELNENEAFLDVGSGGGSIVYHVATTFPQIFAEGVEILEHRYVFSLENYEKNKQILMNINFIHDSFCNLYFGNYHVIYCCNTVFSKEMNEKLYKKIINEFTGYFLLFTYSWDLKLFLKKKLSICTSWKKEETIYLFFKPY